MDKEYEYPTIADEEFRRELAEQAEETRLYMNELSSDRARFEYVRRCITDADLAVAVWPDADHPNGVDMLIIKGENMLRELFASNVSKQVNIRAIPHVEFAHAVATRQLFIEPSDRVS